MNNLASISDISQLISLKERELHEIHGLRCSQLENVIKEKDNVIKESNKRFQMLKEDFQYNLELLDARDQEISRLDKLVVSLNNECELNGNEKKRLASIINALEMSENGYKERLARDQSLHKKVLKELQEEIESVRWVTSEEMKSKCKDIEKLRQDNSRLVRSNEESLEAQRKDLNEAFEQLLQQRENTFLNYQKSVSLQITNLEIKYESLQTENVRIRGELHDAQHKINQKTEEINGREEQYRLLHWTLEDERHSKQITLDSLQRQLQQAQHEMQSNKEKFLKDLNDYKSELSKSNLDYIRENELRESVERALEDARTFNKEEELRFRKQLSEYLSREDAQNKEILQLQSERDALLLRSSSYRLDCEEATHRAVEANRLVDELRVELDGVRVRLRDSDAQLQRVEISARQALQEADSRLDEAGKKEAMALSRSEEASASLRAAEEIRQELLHSEDKKQIEAKIRELQKTISDMEESLDNEKQEKSELISKQSDTLHLLQEEKAESAALRLRLQLLENQRNQPHQEIKTATTETSNQSAGTNLRYDLSMPSNTMSRRSPANIPRRSGSALERVQRASDEIISGTGGLGLAIAIDSPQFSEDQGPASLPMSPIMQPLSSSRRYPERLHRRDLIGFGTSHDNNLGNASGASNGIDHYTHLNPLPSSPSPSPLPPDHMATTTTTTTYGLDMGMGWREEEDEEGLEQENRQLKAVIREMRQDVEGLREQVRDQKTSRRFLDESSQQEGNVNITTAENMDRVTLLENRLQQAVQEVSRLREERSKLMDVGNELRAVMHRRKTNSFLSTSSLAPDDNYNDDNNSDSYSGSGSEDSNYSHDNKIPEGNNEEDDDENHNSNNHRQTRRRDRRQTTGVNSTKEKLTISLSSNDDIDHDDHRADDIDFANSYDDDGGVGSGSSRRYHNKSSSSGKHRPSSSSSLSSSHRSGRRRRSRVDDRHIEDSIRPTGGSSRRDSKSPTPTPFPTSSSFSRGLKGRSEVNGHPNPMKPWGEDVSQNIPSIQGTRPSSLYQPQSSSTMATISSSSFLPSSKASQRSTLSQSKALAKIKQQTMRQIDPTREKSIRSGASKPSSNQYTSSHQTARKIMNYANKEES